jgi:hypothetical protein
MSKNTIYSAYYVLLLSPVEENLFLLSSGPIFSVSTTYLLNYSLHFYKKYDIGKFFHLNKIIQKLNKCLKTLKLKINTEQGH